MRLSGQMPRGSRVKYQVRISDKAEQTAFIETMALWTLAGRNVMDRI